MIIGTCGFGSTGSSAVTDYLLEYEDIQVLDKIELNFVYYPDGLIDLRNHLFNPHCRMYDSIIALKRYRDMMDEKAREFKKYGGYDASAVRKSTETFLNSIVQLNWNWYYESCPKNIFKRYIAKYIWNDKCVPFIENKLGHQINCYPMERVSFAVRPDGFDEAARQHVKEILTIVGADCEKNMIIDQPFSGENPQACFDFYQNPYAIVVDRDPRDNYVFTKTKLLGRNHYVAINSVEEYCRYYRSLRENQPYKQKNDRILSIHFEDLVYYYDETTKKIRKFLNLGINPNPKTIFNPEISKPNTQVWKRFPQFSEDIKYIERELKDYLFDFSGLPAPDPNGKMFFGASPLNDINKRFAKK